MSKAVTFHTLNTFIFVSKNIRFEGIFTFRRLGFLGPYLGCLPIFFKKLLKFLIKRATSSSLYSSRSKISSCIFESNRFIFFLLFQIQFKCLKRPHQFIDLHGVKILTLFNGNNLLLKLGRKIPNNFSHKLDSRILSPRVNDSLAISHNLE